MIMAILQARLSSKRFPGKVLKPLMGAPMLIRQIERVKRSTMIDKLLVATSVDPSDDALEVLCRENGLAYYRGSLEDVLDRYYQAAKLYNPDHIVRLTGDCPLADAELIDQVIAFHIAGNFDYTSNTVVPSYPDGLDTEILTAACLYQAWLKAVIPSQREHVTPFVIQHPKHFSIGSYKSSYDLSYLRWTVDEPVDFELVSKIYEALYPRDPEFSTEDILAFLHDNPELMNLNSQHERNEGYMNSLTCDAVLLKKKGRL